MVLSILIACTAEEKKEFEVKQLDLSGFKVAQPKDSVYTGITVLETYSNEQPCNNVVPNANLYVLKKTDDLDTLYVFDTCSEVPWFVKEIKYENFAILKEDIKDHIPDKVNIIVPKSFKLPPYAKIMHASLTRLED